MNKLAHYSIISVFTMLYIIVSFVSMFHVVDFFAMSNSNHMAWILAIAFEIGAAASLASIIVADKMNKTLIWSLFILLTSMQIMGNMFSTYSNIHDYQNWIELFGLNDYETIFQKRIMSIVSGAILPIVALGYIKALVDYLRPKSIKTKSIKTKSNQESFSLIKSDNLIENKPMSKPNGLETLIKTGDIKIDNNEESEYPLGFTEEEIDNNNKPKTVESSEKLERDNTITKKEPDKSSNNEEIHTKQPIRNIESVSAGFSDKRNTSPNKYKINTTKQNPKNR